MVIRKAPTSNKRTKTGPYQRKISHKTTSKWQQVPADLRRHAMMILEDAAGRFGGSEEEEIDEILKLIKDRFLRTLTTTKVPAKKLTPEKEMKSMKDWLQSESKRLKELELNLKQTLELETRKVEKLEETVEQIKMADNVNGPENVCEIHPILKNMEEL